MTYQRVLVEDITKRLTTSFGQKLLSADVWFVDDDGALSDCHTTETDRERVE